LKVVLIAAFLIAGVAMGTPQPVSFAPQPSDFAHITSAPFAIGLVFVMYSFSGGNAATYIIGEMRMPQRNLPRAMLTGTLIVLVLYVALNAVFLRTARSTDWRAARMSPASPALHPRRSRRPHRSPR